MNEKKFKSYIYDFTIDIFTALFLIFGVNTVIIGAIEVNVELTYRGLNFTVISCALMLTMKKGYLSSNNDYWNEWRNRNKTYINIKSVLVVIVCFIIMRLLLSKGFYS